MDKLHSGAKWLFRFRGYVGAFIFMIFFSWAVLPIVGIIGALVFGAESIGGIVVIGFVVYVFLIIFLSEVYANLAYNRWFYEFTPTNLKIERGIIWKKYSNVPYGRVQNVDIHRGILARMLGFSSVAIQTAGLSYSRRGGAGAEGSIPAVSVKHAEDIREFLMKKISKSHGQGM